MLMRTAQETVGYASQNASVEEDQHERETHDDRIRDTIVPASRHGGYERAGEERPRC